MYSPDQLNAIGTIAPMPAITLARNIALDPRNYNIYTFTSLAFDKAGDLWVANEAPNTINEFPPRSTGWRSPTYSRDQVVLQPANPETSDNQFLSPQSHRFWTCCGEAKAESFKVVPAHERGRHA